MAVTVPLTLAGCTFSDADKLEYEPGTDSTRARLKLLSAYTNDFSSGFGELTEVDSGGKVNITGGKLEINGTNSWDSNGVYLTSLVPLSTPGRFTIKFIPRSYDGSSMVIGFAAATALNYNDASIRFWTHPTAGIYTFTDTARKHSSTQLVLGTEYTIRCDWDADKRLSIYLSGGIYDNDLIDTIYLPVLGSNIGFQINFYQPNSVDAWEFDDYERFSGYASDNPTVTLADVDSGADDSEWDMSSIDFAGASTGLTYSYAYGNSSNPSNWSAYMDLATLQAETDPTGKYFKLRIKVASDGDTQREITEGTIDILTLGTGGGVIISGLNRGLN